MPVPGTVLDGKYRLVRQLGAGGMGIVYEADHIRLRQPFAIKILQPEFAKESEFLMRFEREARAAALLRSPHVVRVFDVDVSPEGLTYMVMELLEGRDLAGEMLETPPPVTQLIDWIVQACAGLQEAHDNGVVHRDLKPANIFLTKIESGERIAKVLDFGISKLEATSTSHLTDRKQGALGTPTYMAPEQIRNRRVDGRTDLWALGVILYRLLGGRWPFSGKGDQGYMAAVLADSPVPFEVVRQDLPYELASAIMKALEKDPASRHPSANDMAVALLPFGSGRAPLPTRASLPAAALPAGSLASITPQLPRLAPIAIVVPEGTPRPMMARVGTMDTVVDGVRQDFFPADPGPPLTAMSPPAVFAPQQTTARSGGRKRGSGTTLIIAACAAAGIGFGAYMLATHRPARASSTNARATQATAAPTIGTEPLPPPAIDLPSASAVEARPAPTGVPVEPSTTASHRRRGGGAKPPPGPSASESPASAPTPPPPPQIPDHL
jgi:serine/threonine-protein kinase